MPQIARRLAMTQENSPGNAPTDPVASDPTLKPSESRGLGPTSVESQGGPHQHSKGSLPSRYQLSGTLGAGGMGEVLLASDRHIGRDVAIKRMLTAASKHAEARFLREARIQARLDHPAIVPVHELAYDSEQRPFFVMKRLSGTTLSQVLSCASAHPQFSRPKLLRAFADVCLAIEFAHSRGIVHRDLKPANIMLGDFGDVYVLDWGVARILDDTDDIEPATHRPSRPDVTEAGTVLGTPGYIAPEQLQGMMLDARADVFALGCILFEILAGQALVQGARDNVAVLTIGALLSELDARPSRRAPDRAVPPELDTLCVEATHVDRNRRIATARVLAERVEHFLDGDRDVALRKSLAATHIAAARDAMATGDGEAERALAMREAGRAIALDPTCGTAADLVGRLMLEPPHEVPGEVDERLAQIEEDTARAKGRVVALAFLAFLGFIPVLAWIGITDIHAVIVLTVAILLDAMFALVMSRRTRRASTADLYVTAVVNGVVIAIIARLFSPFLIAPGMAAISALIFLADPRLRAKFIIPISIGAVLVPWLLEVSNVWSRTVTEISGDLVLHSPVIHARLPHTEIALALYAITLIIHSGLVAKGLGESQRASLLSVELQAWHLRQLVER